MQSIFRGWGRRHAICKPNLTKARPLGANTEFQLDSNMLIAISFPERLWGRCNMAVVDGDLGFEASLFKAADKLRGSMEPSDYKHVALGLIFLRHISGSFEAKRQALLAEFPDEAEDPDAYLMENVFWVPQEARWSHLQANANPPRHGGR